jgi:hypothetical protein
MQLVRSATITARPDAIRIDPSFVGMNAGARSNRRVVDESKIRLGLGATGVQYIFSAVLRRC